MSHQEIAHDRGDGSMHSEDVIQRGNVRTFRVASLDWLLMLASSVAAL